jgi:alpha/beta superfamily hydrolase
MKIQSRDGLTLEASIHELADVAAGVVFCHPHPKFGGTMQAPLLLALTEAMLASGIAVIRFNFRGVGESEGEPSGGEAEVADALGAMDALGDVIGNAPLAVAGWSFGGAVAIRAAAAEDRLRACAAIAPPVTPREGITAGLPSPGELRVQKPLLIVVGANDENVSPEACRAWAEGSGARFELMPGANHFFWAKYDELAKTVTKFLAEVL